MIVEPNNTIVNASDSGVSSAGTRSVVLSSEITPESDIDLYKFQLEKGDGIILDVDAHEFGSELDSLLRIFDAEGKELAINDDSDRNDNRNLDSYLKFIPEVTGDYYVGINGYSNFSYDPINEDNNDVTDGSTGTYDLKLDIVEIVADSDPDNTISEAIDSGISSGGTRSKILVGEIAPESDVDIYKLQLDEGDGVTFDIDTNEDGSGLDSFLRLFDSEGKQLDFNDNTPAAGEDFSSDAYIDFIPQTEGEYFIAVGSSGNFNYDPVVGSNNLTDNLGFSQGSYELAVNIIEITGDEDPDNTIAEANDLGIGSTAKRNQTIQGEIADDGDTDLYKLQLSAGDFVALDIDADVLDTELDSVLRVFDGEGKQLVFNDDAQSPVEIAKTKDSYILFAAEESGAYYVGVSGYDNLDYDPVNGNNNFTSIDGIAASTGEYELDINILQDLKGSDDADEFIGTPQADLIRGGSGQDSLVGKGGADYIFGEGGDDFLSGLAGDDIIDGGNGADELWGGTGDDTLNGGNGQDKLHGNGGADTYILGSGADIIFDFQDGVDKIALTNDISFANLTIENIGFGTDTPLETADGTSPLDLGMGTAISIFGRTIGNILGVDSNSISEADFVKL